MFRLVFQNIKEVLLIINIIIFIYYMIDKTNKSKIIYNLIIKNKNEILELKKSTEKIENINKKIDYINKKYKIGIYLSKEIYRNL